MAAKSPLSNICQKKYYYPFKKMGGLTYLL